MQYFVGQHEYVMDIRGRLPLPTRYRDQLSMGLMLVQGPGKCLRLFTAETYEKMFQVYTTLPPSDAEGARMRLAFFSNSQHVELDKQNRILIPPGMRAYADLERDVIVAGQGEWLSLWNPSEFKAALAEAVESQA